MFLGLKSFGFDHVFKDLAFCAECGYHMTVMMKPLKEWVLNGVTYKYNGTAANFHRLEQEKSPLAYEAALHQEKAAMAATVYAEAGAQNSTSKKAVANVINNRVGTSTVNEKGTRNTIKDVVSEPAQFSSYGKAMYNEAMNYYINGTCDNAYNKRVIKECMQIVIPIYAGEAPDITNGCIFFYSPVSMIPQGSIPDWAKGMKEVHIDGVDPWYFTFVK